MCPCFSPSRTTPQGIHPALGTVLGAGTQRGGRKGLVPALEEPRSRGAADQQANSPTPVLEAMGTQGWVWALVAEEKTLVLILRIRTSGTCLDEEGGRGPSQRAQQERGPMEEVQKQ